MIESERCRWTAPHCCHRSRVASLASGVQVEVEDIKRVYTLFVDVKRSTQFLIEYQSEFMFSEIQSQDADMTDAQLAHQCNTTVLRVPGTMPIARYHLPVPDPRGAAIEWQYACAVRASESARGDN